jgi:hypothetical protein
LDDDSPKSAAELLSRKFPPLARYWPNLGRVSAPQTGFLVLDHLEAFYGGAAGGGKSDALLAGALQYVDVPGYAALILRRTFKQLSLPGAIMARSKEWLAPFRKSGEVHWNDDERSRAARRSRSATSTSPTTSTAIRGRSSSTSASMS